MSGTRSSYKYNEGPQTQTARKCTHRHRQNQTRSREHTPRAHVHISLVIHARNPSISFPSFKFPSLPLVPCSMLDTRTRTRIFGAIQAWNKDSALSCGHVYCKSCVEQLRLKGVDQACPFCRKSLPPGPDKIFDKGYRKSIRIIRKVSQG